MTILRAEGLGKKYRRIRALSDCTLDVPAGRVVGLVGPNGAGKSTLLNLAVGMLTPTSGTIEVLGARPGATHGPLPSRVRATRVGTLTAAPADGALAQSTPRLEA